MQMLGLLVFEWTVSTSFRSNTHQSLTGWHLICVIGHRVWGDTQMRD
jgi:hypothetical protein